MEALGIVAVLVGVPIVIVLVVYLFLAALAVVEQRRLDLETEWL
ncbi:hypothetical protein [Rhodococcus sp. T7]|nr:hypothetical protein [Rhodococcus sp. T7]KAF0962386.1 hypothetical protein MLGJGCBP_04523 [Rhodococcus sp. T7]